MIRLKREYLPIIITESETDAISFDDFLAALFEQPANVVYFESLSGHESGASATDGHEAGGQTEAPPQAARLYGIVSYGDVKKAIDGGMPDIPINKNFTSLGPDDHMEARRLFKGNEILSEIPIIENGKLVGEFNRYDSLLILERMPDIKYNRYARQYWLGQGHIAMVRPGSGRPVKQKIYNDWCGFLEGFGADFVCVDLPDLKGKEKEFNKILFVDDVEYRGAKLFFELFDDYTVSFAVTRTFNEMRERMGESRMIDYEEAIGFYRDQGVNVITLTLNDTGSEYVRRIQRECYKRYPDVSDTALNELMKQYDREFFDDLYDPDYARAMEGGFFAVEKTRSTLRLRDMEGDYVNIKSGERRTVGQPDEYERSVFFYGACLQIGAYVSDGHTMESYLQQMLNENGYRVRAVNYGSWGGNIACFGRMATSFIREGDTVVLLLEDFEMDGPDTLNLWEPLEQNDIPSEWLLDNPFHCNHHVLKCYAEAIFERMKNIGALPESVAKAESVRAASDDPVSKQPLDIRPLIDRQPEVVKQFYTDKYFYGWKPSGSADASPAPRICSCNINGNPFTNGHLHLLKTASETMDHVIVFSLEEKADTFTFAERYSMAYDAAKQFDNVTVVPSGLFLSNAQLFPAYYAKVYKGDVREQAQAHIETFAQIAKILGIKCRMVGEEPTDEITNEINKAMTELMPKFGLEPVIIPRLEIEGTLVTGTLTRGLAEEKRDDELARYVPETTLRVIRGEMI